MRKRLTKIIAACIMHDFGKVFEYNIDEETGFVEVDENFIKTWVSHTLYGFSWANERGFTQLARIIAAHHGRKDWGAIIDLDEKNIELVEDLLKISPKDGRLYYLLAEAKHRLNYDYEDVIESFTNSFTKSPITPVALITTFAWYLSLIVNTPFITTSYAGIVAGTCSHAKVYPSFSGPSISSIGTPNVMLSVAKTLPSTI